MDAVTAELVALERRFHVPSFRVIERGDRPDGITGDDVARWRALWDEHQRWVGALEVFATPYRPPAPYVRRARREPEAATPAVPLWRRG